MTTTATYWTWVKDRSGKVVYALVRVGGKGGAKIIRRTQPDAR